MNKVVIVGKGPGWDTAPIKGEVWGISDYFLYRYCTINWEMHDYEWSIGDCFNHEMTICGDTYWSRHQRSQ